VIAIVRRQLKVTRRRLLAVGLATLLAVPAVGIGVYRWMERDAFENLRVCETLRPGITAAELMASLGQPVHRSDAQGETRWYFLTPGIMAGPIEAQIDERTGQVLALRCQDGPPAWITPNVTSVR